MKRACWTALFFIYFTRLKEDLLNLPTLHTSIGEEGEEGPSDASIEASLLLLEELRIARVGVESVIPAADSGCAWTGSPHRQSGSYKKIWPGTNKVLTCHCQHRSERRL